MAITTWLLPKLMTFQTNKDLPLDTFVTLADHEAALAEKDTTLAHAATTIGEQSVEIMRLKKQVAEKDAQVKAEQERIDNLYRTEYDALMHQAVWAMEQLHYYMPTQLDTEASKVQDRITEFLSTPEVQAYQAQQKEGG
jgi:hypothetical protein